ncbi:hypothetical protein [Synechococcus elongatus]|uniref:hypothetical protein n=1 Tax=Synechococcus elongatus TaxID=32046 RepID=UPI003F677BF4
MPLLLASIACDASNDPKEAAVNSLAMNQFAQLVERQERQLRTIAILRVCGEKSKAEFLHHKTFSPANLEAALDIVLNDPKSEPWVSLLGERKSRGGDREYELSSESLAHIRSIYRALAIGHSVGMEDILQIFAKPGSDLCQQVLEERLWLE